jgi:rod shape determining protein RodA
MFGAVDWTAVGIFLALMVMGWLNIYAAVYDEAHSSIFDITQRYGMQLVWIGVSLGLALTVLLLDGKYYHMFAYPVYVLSLLLLLAVAFVGKEVNGARSWIMLGPIALQPTEFMKFATALALGRYMSHYSFLIRRTADLLRVALLLGLPAVVILLQNDTGSAVVYGSFIFMLYREGLNGWLYTVLGMMIALFIFSFLLEPLTLLMLLVIGCAVAAGVQARNFRAVVIYLAAVALASIGIFWLGELILSDGIGAYYSLLVASLLSLVPVGIYAFRARLAPVFRYIALFCASVVFVFSVDYVFDNVMQTHQQKRILDLLGLESDLQEWGYNVNQSKIAIGSGGFLGKGYMQGTQTKYNFVPEQSTDFIFCTVGEEWGFVGSMVVLALFCVLILRLMRMGERQSEAFGRVYCYSVASVFLFHVVVNIGMTIGLMPVIGIPLPLFSYGGSSLIAFTLLFFVAVKLDSQKREVAIYSF